MAVSEMRRNRDKAVMIIGSALRMLDSPRLTTKNLREVMRSLDRAHILIGNEAREREARYYAR